MNRLTEVQDDHYVRALALAPEARAAFVAAVCERASKHLKGATDDAVWAGASAALALLWDASSSPPDSLQINEMIKRVDELIPSNDLPDPHNVLMTFSCLLRGLEGLRDPTYVGGALNFADTVLVHALQPRYEMLVDPSRDWGNVVEELIGDSPEARDEIAFRERVLSFLEAERVPPGDAPLRQRILGAKS